jgi:hypothetical protein
MRRAGIFANVSLNTNDAESERTKPETCSDLLGEDGVFDKGRGEASAASDEKEFRNKVLRLSLSELPVLAFYKQERAGLTEVPKLFLLT